FPRNHQEYLGFPRRRPSSLRPQALFQSSTHKEAVSCAQLWWTPGGASSSVEWRLPARLSRALGFASRPLGYSALLIQIPAFDPDFTMKSTAEVGYAITT